MALYDTAILNGTVVMPSIGPTRCDVGVRDGRVAALADAIAPRDADQVIDARGKLVLPGAVDSHFHIGIYRDLARDAESETRSALAGGVTTVVSYFRTGSHYLDKSGPYRTIFPEVVAATEGHAHTDFGYHLGIMTTEQLDEVDWLVGEQAELLRVFIEEARRTGATGLEAYHKARPPLTEVLSIAEALVLTEATRCPVNLLHLSSDDAVQAAWIGRHRHPHLDIKLETTLHHLALTYETAGGAIGKVNPPIRTDADREALWRAVLAGTIDTVVSDHACCAEEDKEMEFWSALPGFGGTALLYPYLMSEGPRRGLSLARIVELASANPARAFGLFPRKGAITVGGDADLVVLDPEREHVVSPSVLHSAQDFTPFAGLRVKGWPTHTLLRGKVVFDGTDIIGAPSGRYVKRPVTSPARAGA